MNKHLQRNSVLPDTYNVVISGKVLEGFAKEQVASKLAQAFSLPIEKSNTLLSGKSRTVKKSITHKKAYVFKRKLEHLGVATELKRIPQRQEIQESLTLVPVEKKAIENPFDDPAQEEISREVEENHSDSVDSQSVTITGFFTAAGVALLGIFLWLQVAMAFEVEVGYVAWFIGGAVGFSMVMSGSSGHGSGVIAAVFASLSILGGQYLVYDHFYYGAGSPMEIMKQEFDFLSALFLFLGVSTAFKLGTGFDFD